MIIQNVLNGSERSTIGRDAVLSMPGDSYMLAYHFRRALVGYLGQLGVRRRLLGTEGVQTVTGGVAGDRTLPIWTHQGHTGRVTDRELVVTLDDGANLVLLPAGHDAVNNAACVVAAASGDAGGLPIGQILYFINVSGNQAQLALRQSGTAIDITSTGTGTIILGTGIKQIERVAFGTYPEPPQILWLKGGANDAYQLIPAATMLASASARIDQARALFPDVPIILSPPARFVPGTSTDSGGLRASREAIRAAFQAGLPGLVASKGPMCGYWDDTVDLDEADYDPDGIHLNNNGYAELAEKDADAIERLLGPSVSSRQRADRVVRRRPATASISLTANSNNASLPYDSHLSPENKSFAVRFKHYPTALPADNTVRTMWKFHNTHPRGCALGHFTATGNGGGIICYLDAGGAPGTPIVQGNVNTAFLWEALKVNKWHDILFVADIEKLLGQLWIDAQLVHGAIPIPAAWDMRIGGSYTTSDVTKLGAAASFNAALGLYDTYQFTAGPHVSAHNGIDFAENAWFDGASMPEVWGYPLNENTGTALGASAGLANGTLTGAWSAAGVVPKTGIDDGT